MELHQSFCVNIVFLFYLTQDAYAWAMHNYIIACFLNTEYTNILVRKLSLFIK